MSLLSKLLGAATVVAKKVRSSSATTAAQTSGSQVARPEAARSADDPAGASPDEAIADKAQGPHSPTTPDAPAETTYIDQD